MIIKFALKNIKHTVDHLPIFLLSVSFSIMVAFSFFQISMNDRVKRELVENVGILGNQGLATLISIHYFIIFFIFLFVLYSNNFFMRQKRRDVSVLLLAGFSKLQIASYFMVQILVIGLICLTAGIGLGLIFSRLIYMFLLKLMALDIAPILSWDLQAVQEMAVLFALAMLILFLNIIYHITKTRVSFIVDKETRFKKPKENWLIQVPFGLFSLFVLAYELYWWLADLPFRMQHNLTTISQVPAVIASFSIVACYGFFKWTLPLMINLVKKMRLQNDVQLIWLNNLKQSLLQNSFVLTIITLASIVALAIFSALSYAYPYRQQQIQRDSPTQLSITAAKLPAVEKIASRNDVKLSKRGETKVKVLVDQNGGEYSAWSFIQFSSYNQFIGQMFHKLPVHLEPNETIFLSDTGEDNSPAAGRANASEFLLRAQIATGTPELKITDQSKYFPMGRYMYFSNTLVVTDGLFAQITPQYEYRVLGFSLEGELTTKFKRAMAQLSKTGERDPVVYLGLNQAGKVQVDTSYDMEHYIASKQEFNFLEQENDRFKQLIGLAVFVLLFLGLLLVLASGNLLLLKLQDSTFDNLHDFRIYRRLGGTRRELKRILLRQTSIFFFAPVFMAVIANLAFLPVMTGKFKVAGYGWPIVVYIIYITLNSLFYYIAYRNFDTLIYKSVIEKKGD